jgi:hypothetical protein
MRSIERQIQLNTFQCKYYNLLEEFDTQFQELIEVNSMAWNENEVIYKYFENDKYNFSSNDEQLALIASMSKAQGLNRKRVKIKNNIDCLYYGTDAIIENKSFNGAENVSR